jgi:hypothetical protein
MFEKILSSKKIITKKNTAQQPNEKMPVSHLLVYESNQ